MELAPRLAYCLQAVEKLRSTVSSKAAPQRSKVRAQTMFKVALIWADVRNDDPDVGRPPLLGAHVNRPPCGLVVVGLERACV